MQSVLGYHPAEVSRPEDGTSRNGKKERAGRPSRYDLDQVSEDIPIVLTRVCGTCVLRQQLCPQRLGIDREHTEFEERQHRDG